MSGLRSLFPHPAARQELTDHDRLILLEQRLSLMLEQVHRDLADSALGRSHIAERLESGNRKFADWDLYTQRTDEAITTIRNHVGEARLSGDNAVRAVEAVSRELDRRSGERDRQRDKDQDALEDAIAALRGALTDLITQTTAAQRVALDAELAPLRTDLKDVKQWKESLTIQSTLLQKLTNPVVAIILAIATTFIMRWLFP